MENHGTIEVRVSNLDNTLSPADIDIADVRDILFAVETFLFPNGIDKKNRPKISYAIEQGSIRHVFNLPISNVITFNGLITEINTRKQIDFLDQKQQDIIIAFQKKAKEQNIIFEINNSKNNGQIFVINAHSNYQRSQIDFYESVFIIYGVIYQLGGKKDPAIYIDTKEQGSVRIATTKEQLLASENKLYKTYGIRVKGKRKIVNRELYDLIFIDFFNEYKPVFDRKLIDKITTEVKKDFDAISDIDDFFDNINQEYEWLQ